MDRRTAFGVLGLGAVSAVAFATGLPLARAARVPAPSGVLTRLPPGDNSFALTVDDGASSPVIGAFAAFCQSSGTRLTFFVNGVNRSWTDNAPVLHPMVDSGQIQLGNHTWSHPDLTRIGPDAIADQLKRNADFLRNTYGVDGTPFFRPPYGRHNADTDRVAADLGYRTITMWSGTVGDSAPITADQLVGYAAQSFQPGQIVLAHANLPTITHCFDRLLGLIHDRNLQPVSLGDVFG
jgi:peptidoglycan/xylan/chitin deacetylase (PgdA/CDA1 family)